MTTITLNKNTEAGRTLLEFAKTLSAKDSCITISEAEVSKPRAAKKSNPKDKIPNAETLKSIRDTQNGIGVTKSKDIEDLFRHLNS